MKKTTILTFILGSLLGGAATHHVMKNKKYYKAAFEVGEEFGEKVAEKFLTKIEDKTNKKEKKTIEYDHEPEVYHEDKKDYIPIEDFENGSFEQHVKENKEHSVEKIYEYLNEDIDDDSILIPCTQYQMVAERIIYDHFDVESVPYDNKFNISKVYIDRETKKPIGVVFANKHDKNDALIALYTKFFDFFDYSTNITTHPLYGINIKDLDAIFETHLYNDYFKDEDAYYFWPSFNGFSAYQRDLNNSLKMCLDYRWFWDEINVLYFGFCTASSDPCITLNCHHNVDREDAPKGIVYQFDKDELPIKIGFVNKKYADSCYDAICSYSSDINNIPFHLIDLMPYRDFKKLLEDDYNIYIHGDYTDAKMYITDVRHHIDGVVLTIEWTKEEDAKLENADDLDATIKRSFEFKK